MLLLLALWGCTGETDVDAPAILEAVACDGTQQMGVTDTSHSKGDGDASVLMGEGEVPRLDVVICPGDWAEALVDLQEVVGTGGGPPGAFSDETPMYIPAAVVHDTQVWPQVGFRFKGNSSLYSAVRSGVDKLPFRLDFDRYEDAYPDLEDQRFHGFADLKFSSAYLDEAFQRDKLTADLAKAMMSLPASRGFEIGKGFGDQRNAVIALVGQRFEFEFGHVLLRAASVRVGGWAAVV